MTSDILIRIVKGDCLIRERLHCAEQTAGQSACGRHRRISQNNIVSVHDRDRHAQPLFLELIAAVRKNGSLSFADSPIAFDLNTADFAERDPRFPEQMLYRHKAVLNGDHGSDQLLCKIHAGAGRQQNYDHNK